MKFSKSLCATSAVFAVAAALLVGVRTQPTVADEPSTRGIGSALRQAMVTRVVTLQVKNQRGEPRETSARTTFDRNIEAYWISVVGSDIKFSGTTEKQINRTLFAVDPFGKIVNGRELEVTGKLGVRDGSGNWDDTYEGTLTVAVTAVLAER